MGEVWTPRLRECQAACQSPGYGALLQARLLELALGQDGKVAIEALKLLVGTSSVQGSGTDPVLAGLGVEQLEAAYERAERFIFGVGGDSSAGGEGTSEARARQALVSALRFTDNAGISGGGASLTDHGRVADGGGEAD